MKKDVQDEHQLYWVKKKIRLDKSMFKLRLRGANFYGQLLYKVSH